MTKTDIKLEKLTDAIERLVARPPIPAIAPIPPIAPILPIPAIPAIPPNGDHDSITTLVGAVSSLEKNNNEKFADIKADIKDLRDGNSVRLDRLEVEKLNICDSYPAMYQKGVEKTLDDHEKSIRNNTGRIIKIMAYGTALLIGIGILEPIILAFFKVKV